MDELASDLRHSLNDPDGNFVQRAADKDLTETRAMSAKDREEIRRRTTAAAGAAAGTAAGTAAGAAGTGSISQATQGFKPVSGANAEDGTGGGAAGSDTGVVNSDTGAMGEGLYPSESDADRDDYKEADEEDQELAEDERRLDRIIQILSIVAVIVIGFVIILVAVNRRTASADKQAKQDTEKIESQKTDEQETDDGDHNNDQQEARAAPLVPSRGLHDVLHCEIPAVLDTVDAFVLRSVVREDSLNVLHSGYQEHVKCKYCNAENGLRE